MGAFGGMIPQVISRAGQAVVLAAVATAYSPILERLWLSAQEIEVTGTVTDAVLLTPVSGALVEILDVDGTPIMATRTGANGVYRLILERTPIVFMRAAGFAFGSVRRAFRATEGVLSFTVPFQLDRAPIKLDPLIVIGQRSGLTPGRILFEQHRELGKGTFFTGKEIWERDRSIQAILLGEEGFLLRMGGTRTNVTGTFTRGAVELTSNRGFGKCLAVMVDGWYVQRQRSDFLDIDDPMLDMMNDRSSSFEYWIEEIVASAVHGMEVYPAFEDVPEDLRIEAYPCGLIIIWQEGAWKGAGGG